MRPHSGFNTDRRVPACSIDELLAMGSTRWSAAVDVCRCETGRSWFGGWPGLAEWDMIAAGCSCPGDHTPLFSGCSYAAKDRSSMRTDAPVRASDPVSYTHLR